MTIAEKYIINTYLKLFESLNSLCKVQLLKRFSKSLEEQNNRKKREFFESFGAFSSDKSPEDIISQIKSHRKFRSKDLKI